MLAPSIPRPRLRLAVRRPSLRLTLACAGTLLLLGLGLLWLRDSSLVAVRQVTVTGLGGPEAPRVRAALEAAAQDMTTLHLSPARLRTAVEPFSSVRTIEVSTDFPHGLRVVVHEQVAVAAVVSGDERVAVAPDGTLLRATPAAGLPEVQASAPPGGARLVDRALLRDVAVLAAVPPALRGRVQGVELSARGLAAPLDRGPTVYLGDAGRLAAKWAAAAAVLADPGSAGAAYVDVRVPERPAAGGLSQGTAQPAVSAVETTGVDPQAGTAPATP
jgi:cell division protein FtsQ